ncbi:unnamed protein product [Closterium sp. NIES-53]
MNRLLVLPTCCIPGIGLKGRVPVGASGHGDGAVGVGAWASGAVGAGFEDCPVDARTAVFPSVPVVRAVFGDAEVAASAGPSSGCDTFAAGAVGGAGVTVEAAVGVAAVAVRVARPAVELSVFIGVTAVPGEGAAAVVASRVCVPASPPGLSPSSSPAAPGFLWPAPAVPDGLGVSGGSAAGVATAEGVSVMVALLSCASAQKLRVLPHPFLPALPPNCLPELPLRYSWAAFV